MAYLGAADIESEKNWTELRKISHKRKGADQAKAMYTWSSFFTFLNTPVERKLQYNDDNVNRSSEKTSRHHMTSDVTAQGPSLDTDTVQRARKTINEPGLHAVQ